MTNATPAATGPLWSNTRIGQEFDKRVWRTRHASGSVAELICREVRDDLQAEIDRLTKERDAANAEIDKLKAELAWRYAAAIEVDKHCFGRTFKANFVRYRELTGREYGKEDTDEQ